RAPQGWSRDFARRVEDVVLNGYSAFDRDDAERAGKRLLQRGPIRIKRTLGIGGLGQFEVHDSGTLPNVLGNIDEEEIASYGVVVEENLADITTCSVGQVRVCGIVASYYGTQSQTRNNSGHSVYGGSDLSIVQGDFEA